MKKTRSLVALTVAASVTLSMAMPVFGMNAPGRFATGTPIIAASVVEVVEVQEAEEFPAYPSLNYSVRTFRDHEGAVRGRIPTLSPAPEGSAFERLNQTMWDRVFRAHFNAADARGTTRGASNAPITNTFDGFWADFTVEEHEVAGRRYTVIVQTIRFGNATHLSDWATRDRSVNNLTATTFIDRSTNTQVSSATVEAFAERLEEYLAGPEEDIEDLVIEEAEVVELEEDVDAEDYDAEEYELDEYAAEAAEGVETTEYLLPLAAAVEFGFEVSFDEETNLAEVLLEETLLVSFTVGYSVVTLGEGDYAEEAELSGETLLQYGEVFVPVDFFTEILGIAVNLEFAGEELDEELDEELEEEELEDEALEEEPEEEPEDGE